MRERWMAAPVHARHHLGIELDLLVERAAESVEKVPLDGAPQPVGVDHQPTIVGADHAFDPDAPGLAIHFHFGDLRDRGPGAVSVGDTPTCENAVGAD